MNKQNVFWFVAAIVGAVLAFPIAFLVTCTAREPRAHLGIGYGIETLMIGFGVGLVLTIALIIAAVVLRPGKGDKSPEDKKSGE